MIVGPRFREFVLRAEDVDLGRAVVMDGRLRCLRDELNLSRAAMAELLYTSTIVYSSWEVRPVKLWPSTAERVGRFYRLAIEQMRLLDEDKLSITRLVPLYIAASMVGVPQELFLRWYRDGHFEATDLGILGLWVHLDDVSRIRDARPSQML